MSRLTNVCVIGAGAAGLCAVRHLTALRDKFNVIAYEQAAVAGGTWVYTDQTGCDANGLPIHSSMYHNLRTNLPKEVMAFPDFPFNKSLPSFVGHQEVRKYLDDYADHFDIRKHVKFNTVVEKVEPQPTKDGKKMKWKVQIRPVGTTTQTVEEQDFDAVIVCNGHYSVPLIPKIPGLETFSGNWMHSHEYRHPETFKDQTVLVLGAASSGTDIALDTAAFAKKVYLSHSRPPLFAPLPKNLVQTTGISQITNENITLSDNTVVQADTIIFCTGYHYKFPFFSDNNANIVNIDKDEVMTPLYKHLIHIKHPSLSFVGIPKQICPFPLFDCQIQLLVGVLSGRVQFPTEQEMLMEMRSDIQHILAEGSPMRYAHTMGEKQWTYNDDLAKLGEFQQIPRVVQTLYEAVHMTRAFGLTAYKNKRYELIDDERFEEIELT